MSLSYKTENLLMARLTKATSTGLRIQTITVQATIVPVTPSTVPSEVIPGASRIIASLISIVAPRVAIAWSVAAAVEVVGSRITFMVTSVFSPVFSPVIASLVAQLIMPFILFDFRFHINDHFVVLIVEAKTAVLNLWLCATSELRIGCKVRTSLVRALGIRRRVAFGGGGLPGGSGHICRRALLEEEAEYSSVSLIPSALRAETEQQPTHLLIVKCGNHSVGVCLIGKHHFGCHCGAGTDDGARLHLAANRLHGRLNICSGSARGEIAANNDSWAREATNAEATANFLQAGLAIRLYDVFKQVIF